MNKVNEFKSISYIKGTFPWQWKPDRECGFCWSFDSDIIDAIKAIRCCSKKRPDENTIVYYLCKSYPDCNVTTIRQMITYLENENKILNKPHNGKNSYYLMDGSAIIPNDSASPDDWQSIVLFDPDTPMVNPAKEQATFIKYLNGKLFSQSSELMR